MFAFEGDPAADSAARQARFDRQGEFIDAGPGKRRDRDLDRLSGRVFDQAAPLAGLIDTLPL